MLIRPTDAEDAARALHQDGARLIAGGTALLVDLARGAAAPAALVDLGGVDELHELRAEGGALRVGAAVTLAALVRLGGLLGTAARLTASHPVRLQATVGGNLRAASWPRDLLPVLWCLGARAVSTDGEARRTDEVELAAPVGATADVLVRLEVPATEGSIVAGGGATPSRPVVRVVTCRGAARAVAVIGPRWYQLPDTAATLDRPARAADALTAELVDLGVPTAVARSLGQGTAQRLAAA